MGGHAAGEVASQLAIETLFAEYYTGDWVDARATLAAAVAAANRAVWEAAEADVKKHGMGTTLVAALYHRAQGLIVNVGDSRAYRFRAGKISQITTDHSWVAEQVQSGVLTEAEAAHHPFRNVITRSLGSEPQVEPAFFSEEAQPGDIILLCSDGLSNPVKDKEMAAILRAYPLDEAAGKLIELALERGAPDNVTLVLLEVQGKPRSRSHSFLPWFILVLAVVALSSFLFWTYGPSSEPTRMTLLTSPLPMATFTPAMAPAPLTPAPAATPTPGMMQVAGTGTGVGLANGGLRAISGVGSFTTAIENETIEHLQLVGEGGRTYVADLGSEHFVAPDGKKMANLILVGYEKADAEGVIIPQLVLGRLPHSETLVIVWQANDDAPQGYLDAFSLQGRFNESRTEILMER
jgi:serine/threonine protein phosphatase PrpC